MGSKQGFELLKDELFKQIMENVSDEIGFEEISGICDLFAVFTQHMIKFEPTSPLLLQILEQVDHFTMRIPVGVKTYKEECQGDEEAMEDIYE